MHSPIAGGIHPWHRYGLLFLAILFAGTLSTSVAAKVCDNCGDEVGAQSALLWNILYDSQNIHQASGATNSQGLEHLSIEWATVNLEILDPIHALDSKNLSQDQSVVFGGSLHGSGDAAFEFTVTAAPLRVWHDEPIHYTMLPFERATHWADELQIVRVVLTQGDWGGPNGFVDNVAIAIIEWWYSDFDSSGHFLTAIPITYLPYDREPEEYLELVPDAIIDVIITGCIAGVIAIATCQAKKAHCLTDVDENFTICNDWCAGLPERFEDCEWPDNCEVFGGPRFRCQFCCLWRSIMQRMNCRTSLCGHSAKNRFLQCVQRTRK